MVFLLTLPVGLDSLMLEAKGESNLILAENEQCLGENDPQKDELVNLVNKLGAGQHLQHPAC